MREMWWIGEAGWKVSCEVVRVFWDVFFSGVYMGLLSDGGGYSFIETFVAYFGVYKYETGGL